eukprot:TRINITY_DN8849_c0_g1_i1.p1 TRINITY_DN8849_c0_g1~~TRINITY_DN8849_c0_g1_i1.p1  ORF type:complete len:217 (+),score=75.14 TRINITY_DN8849_c0_g1_i1:63-713(+)
MGGADAAGPPVWHSLWNTAALVAVVGANALWWLVSGPAAAAADAAGDAAVIGYQLTELAIDIAVPAVTSSVAGAVGHHLTTAGAVAGLRHLQLVHQPSRPAAAAALCSIKHQVIACGEWQNLPRMLARLLRRGTAAHSAVQAVSDALLVVRLIWWPLICPLGIRAVRADPTLRRYTLRFAPFYIAHYFVYLTQLRLFRKDITRLWSAASSLFARAC